MSPASSSLAAAAANRKTIIVWVARQKIEGSAAVAWCRAMARALERLLHRTDDKTADKARIAKPHFGLAGCTLTSTSRGSQVTNNASAG